MAIPLTPELALQQRIVAAGVACVANGMRADLAIGLVGGMLGDVELQLIKTRKLHLAYSDSAGRVFPVRIADALPPQYVTVPGDAHINRQLGRRIVSNMRVEGDIDALQLRDVNACIAVAASHQASHVGMKPTEVAAISQALLTELAREDEMGRLSGLFVSPTQSIGTTHIATADLALALGAVIDRGPVADHTVGL